MAAGGITQRRIIVGAALCVLAFTLVGIRLVDVTLFSGSQARSGGVRALIGRADLIDRNGELIARDLPVQDLYAKPHALWDKDQAAHDLALATGASEARLRRVLKTDHNYALIARRLSPGAQERVMRLGLPGLEFERGSKRFYPDGRMTAQVLGVTDPDGHGVSGLELGLDKQVYAQGEPVALSLDMRVQYVLAHEVAAAHEKFKTRSAGGVVLDVNTGEILGMVSMPDFDPNLRGLKDGDSTRNIMTQDLYELGSVFKIITFAKAIDAGLTTPDEILPINRNFKIGRHVIGEAEALPPMMAVRDVLAQSSNIGTSQIALRIGGEGERDFLMRMGLMHELHSELPETARPLTPRQWGEIETATVGFGHGISVTPLSFAIAAASVVNGGHKITPTFLKKEGPVVQGPQVIAPRTSATMREMMRYIVTNGTGKKAEVPGYFVMGKTGSAEKPGPRGGYQERKLITSFVAAFPADKPRYLVYVMLDEPHGNAETFGLALAGWTAAPTAGKVIARIAPILNVPKQPVPVKVASGGSS